jgi:hypothetical protein
MTNVESQVFSEMSDGLASGAFTSTLCNLLHLSKLSGPLTERAS